MKTRDIPLKTVSFAGAIRPTMPGWYIVLCHPEENWTSHWGLAWFDMSRWWRPLGWRSRHQGNGPPPEPQVHDFCLRCTLIGRPIEGLDLRPLCKPVKPLVWRGLPEYHGESSGFGLKFIESP